MNRPIGVALLAIGAGLAGLYEVWRMLVFLGIVSFTNIVGNSVSFPSAQWGQALWALLLAAIWFWVAEGFWNVRGYAWSFGIFISIFTMIFGFFSLITGPTSTEFESAAWLLSIVIFFYLNYPGVRNHFIEKERAMMTPEQRAAMDNLAAANAAAAAAMAKPSQPAAAPTQPAPAPKPPDTPSSTPPAS
jgi:hypothetical protein